MGTLTITDSDRELAVQSLRAFDVYAAINKEDSVDEFPTLRRLQIEHHRWQARALPDGADRSLAVMVLGLVEEACWELPVAVEENAEDEIFDTLGDVMVYTCATCTDLRLDFMTLARDFDPSTLVRPEGLDGLLNLYKAVGMLAHVVGKNRQKTRGYDDINQVREHASMAIAKVLAAVQWLCFSNDWEATVVFEKVLTTRVMKRDWNANKLTGQQSLPLDAEG